ncbi:MAG: T9SS type A sorting domain-containing protein [candidate division Zixibacteria bacterium]|nr:T9SS type A sorting domain-containing protein [candidate division Zixibacteria bacterium]
MRKFLFSRSAICFAVLFIAITVNAQGIDYINSFYWSGVSDVKVNGNHAYCAFDPGLVILDITDIEEPTFVSRLYIPGDNHHIVLANRCAYIFGDDDQLRIIDITEPENPWLLSEIPIDADVENIWVDENYIYAAAGHLGMLIIDISDPATPEIISQFDTEGTTKAVVVRGDIAYISERHTYPQSRPFQVVNVIDRYNPGLVGYITDDIGWNFDLVIDGDYAYLANGSNGLIIIDISNGTHPTIITYLDEISAPTCLFKLGDLMFTDYGYDTLNVFDVSSPLSPELVGFYEIGSYMRDFDIAGNYLFAAVHDLSILDISDIANISEISRYESPGEISSSFIVDNYLYAAERSRGLRIHSLTDPENPAQVYHLELPLYYYNYHLDGDNLYALCSNELIVFDVSDPTSPVETSNYTFDEGFFQISVDYPYMYLTSQWLGVSVYEIISQDSVEYIRGFNCDYITFDAEVENSIGYFSQCFELLIYDLTDPADSVLLARMEPVAGAGWLFKHDNYIYTQCDEGARDMRISIIDVADHSTPLEIGQLYLPGHVADIHFDNDLAYFATYPNGLDIYNISDPYSPIFLGSYNTPGYIQEVSSSGNYIYVADGRSMIVLHLTTTGIEQVTETPRQFSLSPNYPNPFNAITTIRYDLPISSRVTLDIYDILGRKLRTLHNGPQPAGSHSLIWNADGLSSGMYFYKLTAGEYEQTEKMILLK